MEDLQRPVTGGNPYAHRRRIRVLGLYVKGEGGHDGTSTHEIGLRDARVVGFEVVAFSVPRQILPSILAPASAATGREIGANCFIDVALTSTETVATLEFTCTLPEGRIETVAGLARLLTRELNNAMDAESHAFYSTGAGVTFAVTAASSDPVKLVFTTARSGADDEVACSFLFGSGPNAASAGGALSSSAATLLGFEPGLDAGAPFPGPGTGGTDPVPPRFPDLSPWPQLWVRLTNEEVGRPITLLRASLAEGGRFARDAVQGHRLVLLPEPVVISSLRLTCELDGAAPVLAEQQAPLDLTVDVLVETRTSAGRPWAPLQVAPPR